MNKKYIVGVVVLIALSNLISIDIAHKVGYKVGIEEHRSYIRKLEIRNDRMGKVSKQVIKETIEAFRNEAKKLFHYGDLDAYLNCHETIKTYQMALDSIDSYSLLGDMTK